MRRQLAAMRLANTAEWAGGVAGGHAAAAAAAASAPVGASPSRVSTRAYGSCSATVVYDLG